MAGRDLSRDEINILNSLVEATLGSVEGYRRAAERIGGQSGAVLREIADRRDAIVGRLQERVRELGGDPEDGGGILAAAHRAFLSLREHIYMHDMAAAVAAAEHGEALLGEAWEVALTEDRLAAETRWLLDSSYRLIRDGHGRALRIFAGVHPHGTGTGPDE